MMNKVVLHILIPALAPGLFFGTAAMPLSLIEVRAQSLIVLGIAFFGVLAALFAGGTAVKIRLTGGKDTGWWVATSIILAVPALSLLILA